MSRTQTRTRFSTRSLYGRALLMYCKLRFLFMLFAEYGTAYSLTLLTWASLTVTFLLVTGKHLKSLFFDRNITTASCLLT